MLVRVLEDYTAFFACEIDCKKGDLFTVINTDDRWATVRIDEKRRSKIGQIPMRIVRIIDENSQIIRHLGDIPVKDHDLATLAPKEWLNDEIVNGVFSIISRNRPHLFAFSSFFYTKLQKGGYAAIRRWTKNVLSVLLLCHIAANVTKVSTCHRWIYLPWS